MPRGRSILLIIIVALALRVAFAATRSEELPYPDSRAYSSIAHSVAAGYGFREDSGRQASRAPGYPVFLAAFYRVGIQSPRAAYLVQALADAAMCGLLVYLGAGLFGRKAGLIAGWCAALYPFFIYFAGLLLAETLFTLGLVGFMLLLFKCDDALSTSWRRALELAAVAGLLAGVLTHLRSSFLLFPFFLAPFWLLRSRRRGRVPAAWAAMLAVMALTLLPWVARNYRVFGHLIPTTLQVGESLYEANSSYADGGPAMDRIDWVAERGGGMMGEYEQNEFFKNKAMQYIRAHPRRFAALAVEKFRRFWNPLMNYGSFRTPLYTGISLGAGLPVIGFGIFGLWRARRRARTLLLLLAPVFYFSALHMVFVGSVRYRVPVMPLVILVAAFGAAALRRRGAEDAPAWEVERVG